MLQYAIRLWRGTSVPGLEVQRTCECESGQGRGYREAGSRAELPQCVLLDVHLGDGDEDEQKIGNCTWPAICDGEGRGWTRSSRPVP